MSLLLEALKKAERDKLGLDSAQRAAAEQSGLSSLSSLGEASAEETLPGYPSAAAPPTSAVPGSTLELMREEEPPLSPQQSSTPVRPESAHERAAAQNVFAVKQGGAGIMAVGHVGKGLIVAGVVLLAIIGGGTYYVWQEMTHAPGIRVVSGPAPVPAPAAVTTPPPATPITVIPKEVAPLRRADRGGETGEELDITPAPVRARVNSHSTRLANNTSQVTGYPPIEPAIKLQRKQSANEIPPLLATAYQAYLAGDLVGAKQKYLQQLQHDPRNKDVLMGLAAIAVHRQQPSEAQAYYLRVLELAPQDASAIAGMTGLGQQLHPSQAQTESRLKTLLAQQPDAAALHFTLGNHYASQLRWGEAQQAFFRALSIDARNAEYAFNLAVSLDHLNQNKLAAEYYNKALALIGTAPAGFDKAQATTRLKELAQ